MANKIVHIGIKHELIKGQQKMAAWKDLSKQIANAVDFKDFKKNSPQHQPKIIFYNQCHPLKFINCFSIFISHLLQVGEIEGATKEYPPFFYDFITNLPFYDPTDTNEVPPERITEFLENLDRYLINKDHIPTIPHHPFWDCMRLGFQNSHFHFESINTLVQYNNVRLNYPVHAQAAFSNIVDLFGHIGKVTPQVEKRFRNGFPTIEFAKKSIFRPYVEDWAMGIGQLRELKNFLINVHHLTSKNREPNLLELTVCKIHTEIKMIISKFVIEVNKGIFKEFSTTSIQCYRDLVENAKCSKIDLNAIVQEESTTNTELKLWISHGLTYNDLDIITTYLEESNKTYRLVHHLLFFALSDLADAILAFDEWNTSEFQQLIMGENPPRFYLPSQIPNEEPIRLAMDELDKLSLSSTSSSSKGKQWARKRTINSPPTLPPLDKSEEISPPLELTPAKKVETLFQEVRKRLPHVTQAASPTPLLQSVIYLEDIQALSQLPASALRCMLIANGCYRYLEQLLRLDISDGKFFTLKEHHLVRLSTHNTSKEIPFQVITKLASANRWVEYTFDSYKEWKGSYRKIPKLLDALFNIFTNPESIDFNFNALIDEVLEGSKMLLPKSKRDFEENSSDPLPNFKFDFSIIRLPIDDLLSKVHRSTPIARRLNELKKELRLLGELEELLKSEIHTSQLPLITKTMAKLHHAILEHLLIALYSANNYEERRDHDLTALIGVIRWTENLPPNLIESITLTFNQLHRLSNYPFDAHKNESPWHHALILSEVIRSSPELLTGGFTSNRSSLTLGGIEINLNKLSLEPITSAMLKSRAILENALPLLLKELSLQLS